MHRFLRWARLAIVAGVALALAPAARAYPDTYAGRLQALTAVQALNADLLSRPSATETLAHWCANRHIADPPQVSAVLAKDAARPAPPEVRALLGAGAREPIRFRHVQLVCGGKVLSEADNWYLPARLSPQMNHTLDTTQTPFGVAARPLNFTRQTLEAVILFHPFEGDPAPGGAPKGVAPGRLVVPAYVLQHKALLRTGDGAPLAVVVETYTRALIEP